MPNEGDCSRRHRTLCLALLFFGFAVLSESLPAAEQHLTLAEGGKSDYVILLPENPTPVQRTAAGELASTLKEISGADFPIETETADSADPAKKLLVIGPSAASRALLAGSVDEDTLEYDAIVIKRTGNTIVFSGHPVRGMLYAVNTFLEDELGCRWWTAKESFIPKRDKITADDFDTVYAPRLISREAYYAGVAGADHYPFAVRLKCNGRSDSIPEEYGGHQTYIYFDDYSGRKPCRTFVHTFSAIIPPTEFEAHPDWFPEIDGIRKVGYPDWIGDGSPAFKEMCERLKPEQIAEATQLCLTNEELFQEMLKRVLAEIEKNPQATIVSISQNDWKGYCRCAKCRAIAEEEESEMGPYIRFVNRMAAEIEKVYPNIYVETLAYVFTRKPPKLTRARDNVIIRLCSIECSFIQPIASGEQNASFRDDMAGWAQMADHIFVWDYATNFKLYFLPFPNYRVWAENINFFIDHHVDGIFEQGDFYSPTGDFVQMRAWVLAKLLWDPSRNQWDLIKEFIAGYYAPELVPIYLDYFNLLANRFETTGMHLGIFRETANDWVDLETLLKATELMDRAQETAEKLEVGDPIKFAGLSLKVRNERIPLDLIWLMGYPLYRQQAILEGVSDFPTVADMRELALDFNNRLDANKITQQKERTTDQQFAAFKDGLVQRYSAPIKEASVPEICRNLQRGHWLDLQTLDFSLATPGELTFPEEDPLASDGETIRIPLSHYKWSVKYDLNLLSAVSEHGLGTPHVYVFARAETMEGKELPKGIVFQAGVYGRREDREQIGIKSISSSALKEKEYSMIDLGEIPCDPEQVLWIAPIQRTDTRANVYIDRIVITF